MYTSDVTRPPQSPLDSAKWLRRVPVPLDSPKFWITQCGVLIVLTIHTLLRLAGEPTPLTASLMLIPVLYAALAFGVTGAIATASWATALFAVHWLFLRSEPASNTHVWIELVNLAVLMASGIFVGQRVEVAQAALRRTEAALHLAAVAEARYRSLFEDQPSPVIVTDSHDVVTELNTAAIGLLGSAAVGRVLGESLGLTRAELFLKEWPVTVRSAVGAVRNYVPTAHGIDDDVRAPAGQFAYRIAKAGRRQGRGGRIGVRDDLQLLRRARRGDHARAERLGKTDRREPDPAGRAMNQHPVVARQRAESDEPDIGGEVGDADRRGLRIVETGGDGACSARIAGEDLRERVETGSADDPVAGGEAACRIRLDHVTRNLHPGYERQWRFQLILASRHQQIGMVERRRAHPHQQLSGRPRRLGDVVQRHPRQVRRQRGDANRFHAPTGRSRNA